MGALDLLENNNVIEATVAGGGTAVPKTKTTSASAWLESPNGILTTLHINAQVLRLIEQHPTIHTKKEWDFLKECIQNKQRNILLKDYYNHHHQDDEESAIITKFEELLTSFQSQDILVLTAMESVVELEDDNDALLFDCIRKELFQHYKYLVFQTKECCTQLFLED